MNRVSPAMTAPPSPPLPGRGPCRHPVKGIKISLYALLPRSRPMRLPAQLPLTDLHDALRAAGETTRLRILALLAEAELTVSDLTDILRQSQPRISRHLKLLAEAGLVERFREGAWAFFRLAEQGGGAAVARSLLDRLDPADQTVIRDRARLASVRQARAAAAQA